MNRLDRLKGWVVQRGAAKRITALRADSTMTSSGGKKSSLIIKRVRVSIKH